MCPRTPLVAMGVSDRCHCGAVQILISLAQPSCQLVRVRWLSLWHSATFDIALAIVSSLCARCIALALDIARETPRHFLCGFDSDRSRSGTAVIVAVSLRSLILEVSHVRK